MQKPLKLFVEASPLTEKRFSGIPHFTAELVRALDRHPENGRSFELILVIAFDKRASLQRLGYKKARIKTVPLPMRLFNLAWKHDLLPAMDFWLGKGVYLFPNYKNWGLRKSRSLTYIHDLTFVRYPEFVQPNNLAFLRQNVPKWMARSDVVLTGSDHARQEIIDEFTVSAEKIVCIYHGVDHAVYYPRPQKEVKRAKNRYGLQGEYIIYVGSIEPRKNLQRLVAAYQQLPKPLQDQYGLCLVGGGGWLNEDIMADIERAKRAGCNIVQPNQYVTDDDLPSLMSGARLLVHPALYEGFGLSPLQAMSCGTPAVVAGNSSLTEVVGKAGILVDAEDTSDISVKIEKALTDEKYRTVQIQAGLEQAQKFTWEVTAQEILKVCG